MFRKFAMVLLIFAALISCSTPPPPVEAAPDPLAPAVFPVPEPTGNKKKDFENQITHIEKQLNDLERKYIAFPEFMTPAQQKQKEEMKQKIFALEAQKGSVELKLMSLEE